jgi:nucleoside-diphosphate-sugar epimerase
MRVLVLGATGYIGSAVAERLREAGDEVVALVRRGSEPGAVDEVRFGDLADPASLRAAVTPDIGAVVHLATPSGQHALDHAAVEALLGPLRETGRALLYTSGVWVLGPTGHEVVDEDSPTDPIALVSYRPRIEEQVLEAALHGVRGVVIRPGVAHGRGGGIPALLVADAVQHGAGRHVGPGTARWPMVHVADLADLYAAALARAGAGVLLHGVAEEAVPVSGLAAAAAHAAGVEGGVREWPLEQARAELGTAFADALALDQRVSATRTRRAVGWQPWRQNALVDVASGSYSSAARAAANT